MKKGRGEKKKRWERGKKEKKGGGNEREKEKNGKTSLLLPTCYSHE